MSTRAARPAPAPRGDDGAGGTIEADSAVGDAQGVDGGGPAGAPIPASYEAARDELAGVVTKLEEGGLTLDESLALWERGQALAAACETFLAGARKRVQSVLAESEGPSEPV